MGARVRWRPALAAVLGAVALAATVVGGVQSLSVVPVDEPRPVPTRGPQLPGASDPDAVVPPAGAVARPPSFAPSAVVPVPLPEPLPVPEPGPSARPVPESGSGSSAGSPGESRSAPSPRTPTPSPRPGGRRTHGPTSGESQYEYGCRRGYITEGC